MKLFFWPFAYRGALSTPTFFARTPLEIGGLEEMKTLGTYTCRVEEQRE
ncbi:hypothetical protein AWB76_05318 [Caballeronia temeraria]|uniref:Uncharacterized protein n=1 Tax=Caballeronia temeraria TaxID=1777137 RepID=A0A158CAK3_9BURK|nr:hypothetical protein AWB76_05318 [Caballeronia temeraria]